MSDIDWIKAPSHATHWCPGNARIEAGWIYQAGGEFYSCYSDRGLEHIPDFPAWRKARLVPRPTAWTGDGLPPVGVVCEFCTAPDKWHRVEVVAHLDNENGSVSAVFKYLDRKGWRACAFHGEFRPIRTPEQIAEEERKAAIEEMVAASPVLEKGWCRVVCEALYDAGYRKAGDV
ncbi:hypothetical protein [Metapseudomonas otitidis]|uniref:hypothetical protein n=1 Tax=Metapseudomonas otitidis TaxID=319939 RepID=UPI00366F8261